MIDFGILHSEDVSVMYSLYYCQLLLIPLLYLLLCLNNHLMALL